MDLIFKQAVPTLRDDKFEVWSRLKLGRPGNTVEDEPHLLVELLEYGGELAAGGTPVGWEVEQHQLLAKQKLKRIKI